MNHIKRKSIVPKNVSLIFSFDASIKNSIFICNLIIENSLNRKFQTNPNLLASMALGMVAGAAGGMIMVDETVK